MPTPIDDLASRAVAAAVAVAAAHGLRCADPVVLARSSNVVIHLRPVPVVARVSARVMSAPAKAKLNFEERIERELSVVAFLAQRGAPVVPPTAELPPGPYERDGFVMSLWQYAQVENRELVSPRDAGRLLAELHAALRGYAEELPFLESLADEVGRGLRYLRRANGLPADDIDWLGSQAMRTTSGIRALDLPSQTLHGDVHRGNVLRTPRGFLWTDFEDGCRGPVQSDLASLTREEQKTISEVADGYGLDLSYDELAIFRQARLIRAAVFLAVISVNVPAHRSRATALIESLRKSEQ